MRITGMYVTPLAITDPPLRNAAGLHAPYALRNVVEIVTADGIYGLSEVPGGAAVTGDLEAARDIVIGRDPYHLGAISLGLEERFCAGESGWSGRRKARVFGAIEVACLDIVGKATGRPVVDLLGGKVRDHVPYAAYLFFKHAGAGGALGFKSDPAAAGWAAARQAAALTPEGVVAQAQAMCTKYGFTSLKLKAGTLDPEVEVATIFALREAFGAETPLRIDPNGVWSAETAIRLGRRMEGVLEYYEDPVHGQEQMAAVGQELATPLATNMCTTWFDDIPGSVRLHSEDIILMDHHGWGGLRSSMELARICSTVGRGLSMHSNSHLGISLAAMTHLAAAVPNLTYACDTHYPWQSEEIVTGDSLEFVDGGLPVPSEPGLGVELDRAALAALHETYKACGLTRRDDAIEMQKVEPGWQYRQARW